MEKLLSGRYRARLCDLFHLPEDDGAPYKASYGADKHCIEQIEVQRGGVMHRLIRVEPLTTEYWVTSAEAIECVRIQGTKLQVFKATGSDMAKKSLPEITTLSTEAKNNLITVCEGFTKKAFPFARYALRQMRKEVAPPVQPRRLNYGVDLRSVAFRRRLERPARPYLVT